MIRYALVCDKGHAFESWFADSAAYDKQAKRGLVSCPQCGSAKVEKAIMAPRLAGSRKGAAPIEAPAEAPAAAPEKPQEKAPVAMLSPQERELRAKLKELRDHLTQNADNVGPKFPEEARKMHYGEIEHRSIYGEATPDDAKALAEEGIEFHAAADLAGRAQLSRALRWLPEVRDRSKRQIFLHVRDAAGEPEKLLSGHRLPRHGFRLERAAAGNSSRKNSCCWIFPPA